MLIHIAHEVPQATYERIVAFVDDQSMRSIDWSSVNIQVERGDFTDIDEDTIPVNRGYDAIELLRSINSIICGQCHDED